MNYTFKYHYIKHDYVGLGSVHYMRRTGWY